MTGAFESLVASHIAKGGKLIVWATGEYAPGEIMPWLRFYSQEIEHPFAVVREATYAEFAAHHPYDGNPVAPESAFINSGCRFYEVTTD